MKNEPLVSIIIPVYNRVNLLFETLKAVQDQEYNNWECLVVDDGSSDDINKMVCSFSNSDNRFRFYSRPKNYKKGASTCRNIGFGLSTGKYIHYLDSDDLISFQKIELQVNQLENEGDNRIACCGWSLFTDNPEKDFKKRNLPYMDGVYNSCEFLERMGKCFTFFPLHCYLIPRELNIKVGGWDESLTNNDDAEFMARIILKSTGVSFSNKVLAFYRKTSSEHLSNYTNKDKIKSVIRSWNLIEDHLHYNCNSESLIYVENSKQLLFHTIKNKFPYTVSRNKTFFQKEFAEEKFRLDFTFICRKTIRNYLSSLKRKVLR